MHLLRAQSEGTTLNTLTGTEIPQQKKVAGAGVWQREGVDLNRTVPLIPQDLIGYCTNYMHALIQKLRSVLCLGFPHSCIRGRLLEVNEDILKHPDLLLEKVSLT